MAIYTCLDCGKEINKDDKLCQFCGSEKKNIELIIRESIKMPSLMLKASLQNKFIGNKKHQYRISEYWQGQDFNRCKGRYVHLVRQIDRVNNKYYEKIVDPKTNEIIRMCEETLTEHQNRGNARTKKK